MERACQCVFCVSFLHSFPFSVADMRVVFTLVNMLSYTHYVCQLGCVMFELLLYPVRLWVLYPSTYTSKCVFILLDHEEMQCELLCWQKEDKVTLIKANNHKIICLQNYR